MQCLYKYYSLEVKYCTTLLSSEAQTSSGDSFSMEKTTLRTKCGKYAQIIRTRSFSNPKLCAMDNQTESVVVIKEHEEEGKNLMSFHFPDGNNCYSLKVGGAKNLQLEMVSCNTSGNLNEHVFSSSTDFWFERENVNSSRDYGLQAASQTLYLALNNRSEFKLSAEKTECVVITLDQVIT